MTAQERADAVTVRRSRVLRWLLREAAASAYQATHVAQDSRFYYSARAEVLTKLAQTFASGDES